MCTTGINTAKEQGVCDTLFTSTCETKTTKVGLHMNVHIAVRIKISLRSISVQRITLLDSQLGSQWLMRAMVYISLCLWVCMNRMRHVTLGRNEAWCCQIDYKFSAASRIFCRLAANHFSANRLSVSLHLRSLPTKPTLPALFAQHFAHQSIMKKGSCQLLYFHIRMRWMSAGKLVFTRSTVLLRHR